MPQKPLRLTFLAVVFAAIGLALPSARAQATVGRVLSITQETVATRLTEQVCWQKILTERQKAIEEEKSTPWLTRYWQPILGATIGAPIAYSFTDNYGPDSQKWIWPTVAGGAVVGAVAGPGATAGSYGLGSLAYAIWPASLPLTIAFSMAGGVLGDLLWKMVFPPNKKPTEVKPGQYMPDQTFFLVTTCTKAPKVTRSSSGYLVKYLYQGKTASARVKYYPGRQIPLGANGRPIDEIPTAKTVN